MLRRIDWRTSAVILEKLIQYEAVHQIHGWHDLRRRLETDRRCYAFFHPALPDEPIIFIEVALTRGLSDQVQALLDPDSPVLGCRSAEWAIFYSITNCQDGLRGVPFGSFLIKQVVEDISKEFPRIKKFATLSPVPGFRKWLSEKAAALQASSKLAPFADAVAKLDNPQWMDDERLRAPSCSGTCCRSPRIIFCTPSKNQEPLDPVARFHLKNGARLERINWLGDTSASGLQRSVGSDRQLRLQASGRGAQSRVVCAGAQGLGLRAKSKRWPSGSFLPRVSKPPSFRAQTRDGLMTLLAIHCRVYWSVEP